MFLLVQKHALASTWALTLVLLSATQLVLMVHIARALAMFFSSRHFVGPFCRLCAYRARPAIVRRRAHLACSIALYLSNWSRLVVIYLGSSLVIASLVLGAALLVGTVALIAGPLVLWTLFSRMNPRARLLSISATIVVLNIRTIASWFFGLPALAVLPILPFMTVICSVCVLSMDAHSIPSTDQPLYDRLLVVPGLDSHRHWILPVHENMTVQDVISGFCEIYGIGDSRNIKLFRASGPPLDSALRVGDLNLDLLSCLTLRVPTLGGARTKANAPNPEGKNKWGGSIVNRWPDLPIIIQGYLDRGATRQGILEKLPQDNPDIQEFSLKTLGNIIRTHNLKTTRNPQMTPHDCAMAILTYLKDDTVRATGYRKVYEALKKRGNHVPRDFVELFLRVIEPEKVYARRPGSKDIHKSTLSRRGPNEEWSCDGHLKLLPEMGIYIWGIVDVYSRRILHHFVVRELTSASVRGLYLEVVRMHGGIPFQMTLDQGSETNHAAAIQIALRTQYDNSDPFEFPAYAGLKSVYNITVERQWRPLYDECLKNILNHYRAGVQGGVYHPLNETHIQIMRWVWARVVQQEVNVWVQDRNSHRIRRQDDTALPSGGRPDDFYHHPAKWNGENCLVAVPPDVINALIQEHSPLDLFMWATPELEKHCARLTAE